MKKQTHYIDGQWYEGEGERFESIDPSTGNTLWEGQAATSTHVDLAMKAARKALIAWSALALEQRIEYLRAYSDKLATMQDEFARALSEENGKPLWEAATEIKGMMAKVAVSIQAYEERTGTQSKDFAGGRLVIRHKPHGVVAVFGPFNFPAHLPHGHIVPALLAGNTIVFKPSEQTPRIAEMMVKLWDEIGLPQGVLNLVQGTLDTSKALVSHSDIDGVFFTGSSKVGHMLHEQFAGQPHKVLALEMGGNNPLIVKGVKNHTAAVHDIIQSAYITSGQRCTCARRLFIEKSADGDALLELLQAAIRRIGVGAWDAEPSPFMGALISEASAKMMVQAQEKLLGLGGVSLVKLEHQQQGTGFVSAGLIDMTGVKDIPDEEYFGPLLQVFRYDTFDDAIKQANQTKYGLSAGLLADDKADYEYFFHHIRAGIVNWNKQITGAAGAAPFGGVGASGNHRPSAYYAADYCAYPVASMEQDQVQLPETLAHGLHL